MSDNGELMCCWCEVVLCFCPRALIGRDSCRDVTDTLSEGQIKDGALSCSKMLSTGFILDTCDFHQPGRVLVLLRLRGGALYM